MKKWYFVSFIIACFMTYVLYKLTHVFLFMFPPLAVLFVQHFMKTKKEQ